MSNKTKLDLIRTELNFPEDVDSIAILQQFTKAIKAECKGATGAGFDTDKINNRVIHANVRFENGNDRELIFGITRDGKSVKLYEHLQKAVIILGGWKAFKMVYPKLRNEEHAYIDRWVLENADGVVMEGANGRLITLKSRGESYYSIALAKLIQKDAWDSLEVLPALAHGEAGRAVIAEIAAANPNTSEEKAGVEATGEEE